MSLRFGMAAVAGGLALVGSMLFAPDAKAGLESCGNINVSADAKCTVVAKAECTGQCTPVKMELACAGKLEASCRGECNVDAEASCTGSCQADCTGQCSANPGSLDCSANCQGRCEGDCSGKCSASANKGECEASCKASCSGSCSAQCTGTPPSATCDAKGQASCKGPCKAKVNVDCQVSCQSKGYVKCKGELEGGCKVRCDDPEGALFCDGHYVDTGNNLKNCVAALNAVLKVKVSASGSAECAGNECSAEGKAGVACAVSNGGDALDPRVFALGLGFVAVGLARRRRRSA